MFFGGMHFPMGHVLTTRTIFYHLAVFTISLGAYSVLLCSHPVKPSAGLEHSGMNSHSLRGSKHPSKRSLRAQKRRISRAARPPQADCCREFRATVPVRRSIAIHVNDELVRPEDWNFNNDHDRGT